MTISLNLLFGLIRELDRLYLSHKSKNNLLLASVCENERNKLENTLTTDQKELYIQYLERRDKQ